MPSTVADLFATPTADLTGYYDPRRLWPVGVLYLPGPGSYGGSVRRSTLRNVAVACGRALSDRVEHWPTAALCGDPFVASEGRYLPTLAGEPIRDGDGGAVRLPSAAEAAHYAELHSLASPLENVWVRTGPLDAAGDARSWTRGVAGAALGPHPTLGVSLRLAYVGIGVRGETRADTTIRPRRVLRSVAA